MKQKTVMQELIDKFNIEFDKQKFLDWFNNSKELLLEKEKQQALRKTDVSRSAVEPLVDTLFMIATAPHPANDFEYNSFVETAKRIAQKALDDFDNHYSC